MTPLNGSITPLETIGTAGLAAGALPQYAGGQVLFISAVNNAHIGIRNLLIPAYSDFPSCEGCDDS